MTRPFLDPSTAGAAPTAKIAVERVPAAIRKFGFYPNTRQMQPGDLLLVSPVVETPNSIMIRRAQARNHEAFDAQWIHAAAFLGEDSIVEIDQRGVTVSDLGKYVSRHRLQVRRVLDMAGLEVDTLTGYKIAVSALKMFNTKYNFLDLVEIGRRSVFGMSNALSRRSKEAICSDYYNDAVARVLERGAVSAKVNPFTPADLSASTNMVDVTVAWSSL